MDEHTQKRHQFMHVPSSRATESCALADSKLSGEDFMKLVRERERYQWLAKKVDRWVDTYSVPELVAMMYGRAHLPGQNQKALVALSLCDDLSALAALEKFDSDKRGERFQLLHQIALGAWRQRYRSGGEPLLD